MQVIAALVRRKKPRGMIRIVRRSVLIDHCVATAVAAAHKGIELLASHFLFRQPVVRALVGRERGTEEADVMLMRFGNQLLCGEDQSSSCRQRPGG
jgi:hypothetical protein